MNNAIQKMMMALAVCGALITAAQAGSQPMGTRASRAMQEPSGTAMAYPPNAVRAERPIGSEGIAERSECRAP